MSPKLNKIIQGLILSGTGFFFLQAFFSGELYYYINERFFYLVILAGAGLLLLGYTILSSRDEGEHEHAHHHDHTHNHGNKPTWTLLVVSIPLLLGFLIPAQPLDSSVVKNRGISINPLWSDSDSTTVAIEQPADQRTVLDWVKAFNFSEDITEFYGQTADVIGFIYQDEQLAANQVFVGRLTFTCCAADAFAVGVVVESEDLARFADNDWVHVRGEISSIDYSGRTIPLILAESIKTTEAPPQPYLFP